MSLDLSLNLFAKTVLVQVMTRLSAAGGMYYSIPTVTASGDFEIEIKLMVPNLAAISTASMVLGNSGTTNNGMWVTAAGNIVVRDNAGVTHTSLPEIFSGVLHTVRYERLAGMLTGYIDEVEVEPAVAFGAFIFNRIGIRLVADFPFDGIIRSLRVWQDGNRDTGTLLCAYPMTERSGTVLFDESGNDSHGTAVNITSAERQNYTYEPWVPQWVSEDGLTTIPAG